MDTATKDKFVSGTGDVPGNSLWETPPAIFQQLNTDFGPFDVDLTADPERHLCPVWLGPGSPYAEDALTALWFQFGKIGYSNPPYGSFVPKMLEMARKRSRFGFTTVLLLPMRVTVAFRKHVVTSKESGTCGASQLLFCDSRICFYENGHPRWNKKELEKGNKRPDPALFDSIIVIYRPGIWLRPDVDIWHVPPHV